MRSGIEAWYHHPWRTLIHCDLTILVCGSWPILEYLLIGKRIDWTSRFTIYIGVLFVVFNAFAVPSCIAISKQIRIQQK